jgi:hypothetical protein
VRFEHDAEFALLVGVREKTIAKGAAHLLLLWNVPVWRSALGASEHLRFARHPLVSAAHALQFFDCDFHTQMNITTDNQSQERKAAIPLSAKADSPLAA